MYIKIKVIKEVFLRFKATKSYLTFTYSIIIVRKMEKRHKKFLQLEKCGIGFFLNK